MAAIPVSIRNEPPLIAIASLLAILAGMGLTTRPLWVAAPLLTAVAVVVAWRAPGVVYAAYFAIPYYKAPLDPLLPFDLTVGIAMLLGVAAMPFLVDAVRGEVEPVQRRAVLLFTLPVAMVSIGALYAPDTDVASLRVLYVFGLIFMTGITGIHIARDPDAIRMFLVTLVGIGLTVTALSLTRIGDIAAWERISALGVNTIHTAQGALLVPLVGALYLWRWRSARPLVVVGSALALFVAISTGSRGPLLMFLLTMTTFWIVLAQQQRWRRIALLVVVGALVIFLPLPSVIARHIPDMAIWRFANLLDTVAAYVGGGDVALEASAQGRVMAWNLAVDMFATRPLTGWGAASFATVIETSLTWSLAYPHNIILQVMAEYGVIGLAMMAAVIIPAWQAVLIRRIDPAHTTLAAIFVFTFLGGLVSFDLFENRPMWCAMAILLALPRRHHG